MKILFTGLAKPIIWAGTFFNPTDKTTSMMRLGFFLLHIFIGYIIYNIVQISWYPPAIVNGVMIDKSNVLTLLLSLVGILLGTAYGAKVFSKYAENKELTIEKSIQPEVKQ